jgi:hypothetical protein
MNTPASHNVRQSMPHDFDTSVDDDAPAFEAKTNDPAIPSRARPHVVISSCRSGVEIE